MFPVGLYEWKITNVHAILTFIFKNVLKTFEAEILKIFKVTVQFERCFRLIEHISVISCPNPINLY